MTDGTSTLDNSDLDRAEGRHSGFSIRGFWEGALPPNPRQGLCPHTPTGEFPPQTPVSCATPAT